MLRALQMSLCALALSGCAAHEIYEKADLDLFAARADWAECQQLALADTGAQTTRDLGKASLLGNRLVGELAVDPEAHDVAGYKAEDWARISQRRHLRQDCMTSKGYRFLGVPATERL